MMDNATERYFVQTFIRPLKDVVRQAVLCFDAVLIIGSTFAVVFGEIMKGGIDKFLLSENKSD